MADNITPIAVPALLAATAFNLPLVVAGAFTAMAFETVGNVIDMSFPEPAIKPVKATPVIEKKKEMG